MNRRDFLTSLTAGAAVAAVAPRAFAAEKKPRPDGFIRAALLHFGMNMWGDFDGSTFTAPEGNGQFADAGSGDPVDGSGRSTPKNYLRFDYETWKAVTQHMADRGVKTLVIDVAEGLKWPSRPELGVEGSWEADRFVKELDRLRALGLEPIPKMNFSTTHDAWLKDYGHKVSTPEYYAACADVIKDACAVFGKPRLVHIGFEEEFCDKKHGRADDQWWKDLHFLVGQVEKNGARAWAWCDYPAWFGTEKFVKQMPKSVLQSAWWYPVMSDLITCPDPLMFKKAGLFATLEKLGYDQVPCGGNWCSDKNMAEIVRCGDAVVKDGRLKGYLTTTWRGTVPRHRKAICDAIDQLADAIG